MTLAEIENLLDCEVLTGKDLLGRNIRQVCAADLMSDVLALSVPGALLLTGLSNVQSVNTAHVAEIAALVYVRGKKPDSVAIRRAQEINLPLMTSPLSMFEACGKLFAAGLKPGNSIRKR